MFWSVIKLIDIIVKNKKFDFDAVQRDLKVVKYLDMLFYE